ncbi:MAG TPA: Holliday junction branch migration protein RuvA [Candidatus Saccharimonadales bacterium]|nr:Holliday junction branch migration protein RuvA [Candidatus Saccharimonadales bacterium]
MIATLTGKVTETGSGWLVLDISGVGYEVFTTNDVLSKLGLGSEAKLYVHDHIREQSRDLFGFLEVSTKQLFEQLLGVKNVGPKAALAILDIGPATGVRQAIAGGDVKALTAAKGVGKRAAEQVIVELRDKVGALTGEGADAIVGRPGIDENDEAIQALISLGYSPQDASQALAKIDKTLSTEEKVKQALKS